jgi:hypothetical protein
MDRARLEVKGGSRVGTAAARRDRAHLVNNSWRKLAHLPRGRQAPTVVEVQWRSVPVSDGIARCAKPPLRSDPMQQIDQLR